MDLDGIFAPPPGLELVPKRFALGAKVVTEIEAAGPDAAVWADNLDVIRVERVGSTLVELHAVGAGATVIRVEEDGRGEDYAVEVAPHERHEVLLVQRT